MIIGLLVLHDHMVIFVATVASHVWRSRYEAFRYSVNIIVRLEILLLAPSDTTKSLHVSQNSIIKTLLMKHEASSATLDKVISKA